MAVGAQVGELVMVGVAEAAGAACIRACGSDWFKLVVLVGTVGGYTETGSAAAAKLEPITSAVSKKRFIPIPPTGHKKPTLHRFGTTRILPRWIETGG